MKKINNLNIKLKSEVLGEDQPEDLDMNTKLDSIPLEEIPCIFPEFEEYILGIEEDKPKGFLDKAINVLDNAYFTSLHYKERAKLRLKETGIIDKLKIGTTISYENIKKFGKKIFDKSKPIFSDVKTKATIGFESVKEKTKQVIN